MDAQPTLPLYILAGGQSRRFGRDKAEATFDGLPLVCHVGKSLAPLASSVIVIADRAGKYEHLGLQTLADIEPSSGPLAGVVTALVHRERGWCLVAPCDVLGLDPSWFASLLHATARGRFDAAAFFGSHWEPLPALYHTDALPEARRGLRSPNRSLRALLDRVHTLRSPLPDRWHEARRITTPGDLA
jgi:molybdopterin-guanine dinucleotide biosynthesis protein A